MAITATDIKFKYSTNVIFHITFLYSAGDFQFFLVDFIVKSLDNSGYIFNILRRLYHRSSNIFETE